MNTKIIKLDINNKMYETITAKQGDTESRFLLFHLFDASLPFDLTEKSVWYMELNQMAQRYSMIL